MYKQLAKLILARYGITIDDFKHHLEIVKRRYPNPKETLNELLNDPSTGLSEKDIKYACIRAAIMSLYLKEESGIDYGI